MPSGPAWCRGGSRPKHRDASSTPAAALEVMQPESAMHLHLKAVHAARVKGLACLRGGHTFDGGARTVALAAGMKGTSLSARIWDLDSPYRRLLIITDQDLLWTPQIPCSACRCQKACRITGSKPMQGRMQARTASQLSCLGAAWKHVCRSCRNHEAVRRRQAGSCWLAWPDRWPRIFPKTLLYRAC